MKIAVIVNPCAGGWKRVPGCETEEGRSETIARWFGSSETTDLRVWETRASGDGDRLAHEALAAGYDTLVAVGGDGTIHEILQGMAEKAQARLGIVPMGTANALACALGISLDDPEAAAAIVLRGQERRIDLGLCGDRRFALMAGIGLDGAVVHGVSLGVKRRIGGVAYLMTALQLALRRSYWRVTLTSEDGMPRTFVAYQVLVANAAEYGGRFRLGDQVRLEDGLLDVFVCLYRAPLLLAVVLDLWSLLIGRFSHVRGVQHFQVRRLSVEATEGWLPVQLDGDRAGAAPVVIQVAPSALCVLCPEP